MHGVGIFKWPDGKVYNGQYDRDQKSGFGILEWQNGKKYEGCWLEGK